MNTLITKLETLISEFPQKKQEEFEMPVITRLVKKVNGSHVTNDEFERLLSDLVDALEAVSQKQKKSRSKYSKAFQVLRTYAEKEFGFVKRDEFRDRYMATGMAVGVLGAIVFNNVSFMSIPIGICLGMALGLSVGIKKDKEASDKKLVY